MLNFLIHFYNNVSNKSWEHLYKFEMNIKYAKKKNSNSVINLFNV
jgi:hypothetical protein